MTTKQLIIKLENLDQLVSDFHHEMEGKTNEISDDVRENGAFTHGAIANKLDERVQDINELQEKLTAEKKAVQAEIEKISAKQTEEFWK